MSITSRTEGDVTITTIDGEDLKRLQAELKAGAAPGHCVECKKPFTCENVKTPAGWKETTLSGLCETCWDGMFAEFDPEP